MIKKIVRKIERLFIKRSKHYCTVKIRVYRKDKNCVGEIYLHPNNFNYFSMDLNNDLNKLFNKYSDKNMDNLFSNEIKIF